MRTRVITTTEGLSSLVDDYLKFKEFAFDTETLDGHTPRKLDKKSDKPGLNPHDNKVFWISLAGPGRSDAIPVAEEGSPHSGLPAEVVFGALKPLFFSNIRKIGQNVLFDLATIQKYYGEPIPGPYGDTMALVHLLNENLSESTIKGPKGYSLESLSERYIDYKYKEKLGEKVRNVEFERAARYAALDAKMTWLIWRKLHPKLETIPSLNYVFEEIEMKLLPEMVKMRLHGAYVKRVGFYKALEDFEYQLQEAKKKVWTQTGKEINLNSSQQLAEYFFNEKGYEIVKKTQKGAVSVDNEVIRILAKKHKDPAAQAMHQYSDIHKLLSTYIKGFIPHIDDDDRIRASFNQIGPVTGRMSCSDPNLQNIPQRGKEGFNSKLVRELFVAPPGFVLVVGDYSQIELRILAHLTQDPVLLKAYREGLDLHTLTASIIYSVDEKDVTKAQRMIGKTSNFNFAFEGGPTRVIEAVEGEGGSLTMPAAKKIHEAWKDGYKSVVHYWNNQHKLARKQGYVETVFGRRRRLPDIQSKTVKLIYRAERQSTNFPVQGTAADIAKIGLYQVQQAMNSIGGMLTMQVHDEFIAEVPEDKAKDGIRLMKEAMENITLDGKPVLSVPLIAEVQSGLSWSDAK